MRWAKENLRNEFREKARMYTADEKIGWLGRLGGLLGRKVRTIFKKAA
jgi:hypothetical protein